jgi:hypothetical protein
MTGNKYCPFAFSSSDHLMLCLEDVCLAWSDFHQECVRLHPTVEICNREFGDHKYPILVDVQK